MYVLHDNCQSISCLSYLNISDTLTAIIELENYPLILEVSCILLTHFWNSMCTKTDINFSCPLDAQSTYQYC